MYRLVDDLLVLGEFRGGIMLYNPLTIYIVYTLTLLTKISAVTISQFLNPFLGSLAIIPLFFLAKEYLSEKQSLVVCLLYVFSENAFYRTSSFGSVEPVGILFSLTTLYFYKKKRYALMLISLVLTFYGHILPFIWVIASMFFDSMLFGTIKKRVMVASLTIVSVLVLYSPLLPYQSAALMIKPEKLVADFDPSNITGLFTLQEIVFDGCRAFLGLTTLGLFSLVFAFTKRKRALNGLVFSTLLATSLLFVWSWLFYNSYLIAPVRILLYFFLPFSIYFVKTVSRINTKKQLMVIFIIIVFMLSSISYGIERIMWIPYSLTENEYKALDKIQPLINHPGEWYCDYPLRVAFLARSNKSVILFPIVENITRSKEEANKVNEYTKLVVRDVNNATKMFTFNYVFLSERMMNRALFLDFGKRSNYYINPVEDYWANSSCWELLYDIYGARIYRRRI